MMTAVELAKGLRLRANIWHTRNIVKKYIEKVPMDWDGLEAFLAECLKNNISLKDELENYLSQELHNNYKVISLYRLSKEATLCFFNFYGRLSVKSNVRNPAVLTGAKLDLLPQRHVVTDLYQDEVKTRISLTRMREFKVRSKIDQSKLKGATKDFFGEYDELYGVSIYKWQAFDSFVFHHNTGLLEIRSDYTRAENGYQNLTQINSSIAEVVGWLVFESAQKKTTVKLDGALNLFPAIPYFTHTKDGKISKLNFSTPQGSIKHDTMCKGEDLRSEVFYAEGKKAVGNNIKPFDISVVWTNKNILQQVNEIELTVPSSFAIASSDQPVHTYAIIKNCPTDDDAEMLIGKLLGALPDDKAADS